MFYQILPQQLQNSFSQASSEVETQKKEISKHLKTIGAQEEKLKNKALELQKEVTEGLQNDNSK